MNEKLSPFADQIFHERYALHKNELWEECAARVAHFVGSQSKKIEFPRHLFLAIWDRKVMPGGRYLYSAGREIPQISNCFLEQAEDTRESWAGLLHSHFMLLSTGGGVGTEYSDVRPAGAPIKTFGGTASGPIWLMSMVNDIARSVNHHGRKAALMAILKWSHEDIFDFIRAKDWSLFTRAMKEQDFSSPAPLDQTNISIRLDQKFFEELGDGNARAHAVYMTAIRRMLKTGEPGFTVDLGQYFKEIGRNPCGEVTSGGNDLRRGDCCNLGSVNFARVKDLDELEEATALCTEMLFHGCDLGWLPGAHFDDTRKINRKIGVGILGLHEWCLKHGHRYEPSEELEEWLNAWAGTVQHTAWKLAKIHGTPVPTRTRAIAPTGTIGIIAETTTGIEPILSLAYKLRWIQEGVWKSKYVVDPTANRLITQFGFKPDDIEDAYDLSYDVRRRLEMQAFVQKYVDMGISSTINLPAWGEHGNNDADQFATTLLEYLPRLRGITVYPEGARAGQPLTPVSYEEAVAESAAAEEPEEKCSGGSCGI